MTSFALKLIAMVTMVIDHVGDAYFKSTTALNLIGRIAFPIFAFQISEGYTHTKNLKKYFLRLFLFALISQIPFMLFRSLFADNICLNIFFTLFFGMLAIFTYDNIIKSSFQLVKNNNLNTCIKYISAIFPAIVIRIFSRSFEI